MSGFDDDFLAGPAPAPTPVKPIQGAAAAPPPSAPSDDFDGFGVSGGSAQPDAGFLSPEAADAAKATAQALKAKSGAALAATTTAGMAGARRLRALVGRVTPKQWGIAVGGLVLAASVSFGVRWWMHRPASPNVATAKAEAPVAPAASTATVAKPPVVTSATSRKLAEPVAAATMPAAPAVAPVPSPPTAVARPAARPVAVAPKKDPWKVAHAADIQKSMQRTEKTDDAWAKDQSARLDAFFKKKH